MSTLFTHTRSRLTSDGTIHREQVEEFFDVMGWFHASNPIRPQRQVTGAAFARAHLTYLNALDDGDDQLATEALAKMAWASISALLTYGVAGSLSTFFWVPVHAPDQARSVRQPTLDGARARLQRAVGDFSRIGDNPYAARWAAMPALRAIGDIAVLTGADVAEQIDRMHRARVDLYA